VLFGARSARARNRRNQVSAFVGEIVATMDAEEEHAEIERLCAFRSNSAHTLPNLDDLQLPVLTVYESNVGQLMALPSRLWMLRAADQMPPKDFEKRVREAISEVAQTMRLGETLLHSFRRFISRKHADCLSRA
jgi:hypothetical protein